MRAKPISAGTMACRLLQQAAEARLEVPALLGGWGQGFKPLGPAGRRAASFRASGYKTRGDGQSQCLRWGSETR